MKQARQLNRMQIADAQLFYKAQLIICPSGEVFTSGVMANDCTGVQKNFTKQGIFRAGEKICY